MIHDFAFASTRTNEKRFNCIVYLCSDLIYVDTIMNNY
jgi:hypothetical protein